jgi:hypothetical protein
MQLQLSMVVVQRRGQLVRPMDATAIGNHDHLFAGVTKDAHHLMHVLAECLRIKMRHDFIENAGGPILDCAKNMEQDAAGDATPGAILRPGLAFKGLFPVHLAGIQGACGQAIALGTPPPPPPGQRKAPDQGLICVEQDDLPQTGPVLQSSQLERRQGQISRVGIEPTRGPAVA